MRNLEPGQVPFRKFWRGGTLACRTCHAKWMVEDDDPEEVRVVNSFVYAYFRCLTCRSKMGVCMIALGDLAESAEPAAEDHTPTLDRCI